MTINETEILEALASLRAGDGDRPPGVFTAQEGAQAAGIGTRSFIKHLHRIKAAGRLELVQITITRIDGKPQPVMAYRIKPVAKLKRA